jgi:hypothetical protein
MEHDRAATLLADLAHGRLAAGETHHVREHMILCADCREMAEAYALLREATVTDHIDSLAIARLAVHPARGLPPEAARHLAGCTACARDLDAARRANRPAAVPSRRVLLAATGVALVVLGVLAFAGWHRAGSLAGRVAALESAARGVTAYHPLRPEAEGGGVGDPLVLHPGQTHALLGLELPRGAHHPGEPGRVVLHGPEGNEVWTAALSGAEMDTLLPKGARLLVRIPADRFQSGRHRVEVLAGSPDEEVRRIFHASFDVTAPDEDG